MEGGVTVLPATVVAIGSPTVEAPCPMGGFQVLVEGPLVLAVDQLDGLAAQEGPPAQEVDAGSPSNDAASPPIPHDAATGLLEQAR